MVVVMVVMVVMMVVSMLMRVIMGVRTFLEAQRLQEGPAFHPKEFGKPINSMSA